MSEITFGKNRYHQYPEMEKWCRDNIGPGGWTYSKPISWVGMNEDIWAMYGMFGNISYCFKEEKDMMLFVLRWV